MKPLRRRCFVAAFALCAWLVAPGTALAGGETLKRAMGNVLFAPVDMAIAPFTAGYVIFRNLREVDDSMGVKIAYPLFGYPWNVGLFAGTSAIRMIVGIIEFFPGLALLFTDAELGPLFAPTERGDAFYERDTVVLNIKIGIDYSAVPY